ncbi:neuronal acetylcholine receptor subunit alpha-5 [Halyomorpha halys]|uniref:neuronal acetylcholine receptor subunit alpha-5 n=1 Tax=Halyomorpha halys TaxID=286706 RepID=UPI0006D51B1B|nr:neuronal acetylcholine receptor subunit alpha-5-like [Halyomorpha halys]
MGQYLLLILSLGTLVKLCWGGCNLERSTLSRLKDDIFCSYDPYLRPVRHQNNKTLVTLTLYPRHIDFEEERSSLYVDTWIYMTWMDTNLAWNPKDYDNIDYIHVPPNMLWVPDLTVYNKLDLDLDTESHPAVVGSNGRVYIVVMSDFTAYCTMDLTNWPNDEHTCTALLGSRSYSGTFLDFLFNDRMAVGTKNYYANRMWLLKSVNATRKVTELGKKNGTGYLVTVQYQFKVKRHATFIMATVFVPVLLLTLMVLLPLLLPFSSERCYNTLALAAVGHVAYLQYLGSVLPHNADNTILMVAYIRDSLVMAVFALILCIWVDKLASTVDIPIWLSNILINLQTTKYTRMLFMSQNNSKQKSEEDVNLVNPDVLCSSKDWPMLLLLIQRSIFIIYLVIYTIMLIVCF